MADTLKFGPEWLRALSDGSSIGNTMTPLGGGGSGAALNVSTAPAVAAAPKYKLAQHRYGREEMLALRDANTKPPEDLLHFPSITVETCQEPMADIAPSEEELRLMSQSVNSVAVVRLMGGRGGVPAPPPRGGPSIRGGRGRGRGRGDGYYPRPGEEEVLPTGRGRRTDSWEEVRDKRYSGRSSMEEVPPPAPARREFSRSMSSENWRESRKANEEEGGDPSDWRKIPPRENKWGGSTRGNWREPRDRWTDKDPEIRGMRGDEHGRSNKRTLSRSEDGEYDLPEWSTADCDDMEDIGTFDASGAFMSTKEASSIDEENEGSQKSSPSVSEGKKKERKEEDPHIDPAIVDSKLEELKPSEDRPTNHQSKSSPTKKKKVPTATLR